MRVSSARAAKQAFSIFLLVATLSLGQLPPPLIEFPRAFMMDAAAAPSAPLNYLSSVLARIGALLPSGASSADLEKQVAELSRQLASSQAELARAREIISSYEGFRYITGRAPIYVWNAALSGYIDIVGSDTDLFSASYVAGAGSSDGIARGFAVVNGQTAIGVISEVGIWHSRVRVLSDPRSRISIRFARSGREAVLVGTGRNICRVRFVPNNIDDLEIQPGDLVLTSGSDGCFPPDLLVGRVVRFYKRPAEPAAEVEVELFVDFPRIQTCLILRRNVASSAR